MSWQEELAKNATGVQDLLPYMDMNEAERQKMADILEQFPMSVTPYYLSLIDWDDENDPIRKMAIPSLAETDLSGSFDTSGEASNTVIEGMQHKYAQTVMILSTNQCAMYCRHCFRKRLVGLSGDEVAKNYAAMRAYVQNHREISNVLISGGDALLNSNERLEELISLFADIPHLDAIRIASRVPVVFPQRITADDGLLSMLERYNKQKQLIFVSQYNHPRELSDASAAAVRRIQSAGIPVKNQTVLLRGVNATPEVLGELLRRLIAHGIAPYYVFQCRPVSGVKNQFQVPFLEGWQIVEEAKAMQSGLGKTFRYCLSHVTGKLEIIGPTGKTPMDDAKGGDMLFKYHEAQNQSDLGKLFTRRLAPGQAWLDD